MFTAVLVTAGTHHTAQLSLLRADISRTFFCSLAKVHLSAAEHRFSTVLPPQTLL